MPEQFQTFWPVYLAKKSVGCAQNEEVYFSIYLNLPQMLYCWSILLGICSCFAEKQYHYSKLMLYNDIALLEFYVKDFLYM